MSMRALDVSLPAPRCTVIRAAGRGEEHAASRRLGVDYVKEATALGEDWQAALRYGPRQGSAGAERSPRTITAAAADRGRDTGPSR